ncbi:protein FLX-like 1 [Iris pallida]|uniref:Protein FLX-like 1 n=1 Tax=Iris pallida TaxID=29817 RepID=A0AAX6FTN7_IRIPA|nr:protein FLX-like 1 [Iris pallida]
MSGRNRLPHHQDLLPFGRGPPLHPHLLDDMLGPPPPHPHPHHPHQHHPSERPRAFPHSHPHSAAARIEERMAAQHEDVQVLLVDNQRLAATHVALKQELAAVHSKLRHASAAAGGVRADRDAHLREVYEKSLKMEAELRAVEAMKEELIQVRGDIHKLNAAKQELTGQIQILTQDLSRASDDVSQVPAIKEEIDSMKHELQSARQAIEFEKKGYAENYEQGQVMEKNLISMAREVEKLRAEVANADKRARASAAAGNQGAGYGGNYGNTGPSYGGNPYPSGYAMNPVSGAADGATQYGAGSGAGAGAGSGYGSWGVHDTQRTHAHR